MKKINSKNIFGFFLIMTLFIYLQFFFINLTLSASQGSNKTALLFFGKADQFADLLKTVFSFQHIFTEETLINLKVPEDWIYNNPYNQNKLPQSEITILHTLPPLSIIYFVFSAYFAKFISYNYFSLYLIYSLLFFAVFYFLFKNLFKKYCYLIFILLSFPVLFMFDRGHFMSAISGFSIYFVIKNYVKNEKLKNIDIFLFIVSASIRPFYLVFGILFLFNKTFIKNIKQFFKISIIFLILNFIFVSLGKYLFPNYSLESFVYANREFRGLFNSPWDSSIFGSFYNINSFLMENYPDFFKNNFSNYLSETLLTWKFTLLIMTLYLITLFFSYKLRLYEKITKFSFSMIVASISALVSHPHADYHLLLFVLLFLLLFEENLHLNYNYSLVIISLILLPKLHYYSPLLNYSNLINVILLNSLIFVNLSSKSRL